ncbi:hypothetical protein GCM10023231_17140 [Olivibacter ginsenosidimutans]|uniref:Uncharacterized protein n=1 Tax=Olivibacter ginsenosidimutans TaxID=1176537 RepID=A0ABP9B3A6_9SPHI
MEPILKLKQIYSEKKVVRLDDSTELSRLLDNTITQVGNEYHRQINALGDTFIRYLNDNYELNKELVKVLDEEYWSQSHKLKFSVSDAFLAGERILELDFTIELPEILACIQVVDGDNFVCIKESEIGKQIYPYKRKPNFLLVVVE